MIEKTTEHNRAYGNLIKEIELFIEYGVAEEEKKNARAFLDACENQVILLAVLRDFYSRLPEFREEAVTSIEKIVSRLEAYLLSVSTAKHEYLYFYDGEGSLYLGEKKYGIGETEILNYFGFSSNEAFLKHQSVPDMEEAIGGKMKRNRVFCPACSVAEGEIHQLGCPVETCPWCEGQLTYCNCRFEQLGMEKIESEEELDRLEILLNDTGRKPFTREEAPAYPTGGTGE